MKILQINKMGYLMIIITAVMMSLYSCKKDDVVAEPEPETVEGQLIAPAKTVKPNLVGPENYIDVNWQPVSGAISYTIQLSQDTFKTVLQTLEVDSTSATLPDLAWDQFYQVQVRANAADSTMNSVFGFLGTVKTAKLSILTDPVPADLTDHSATIRWANTGATATEIKVYSEPARALLSTVSLTPTDLTNQFKLISGLTPETPYYIEIYSEARPRGYNIYTTKPPVIDLRGILGNPSILQDTISDVLPNSTIILQGGVTYNIASAVSLGGKITIRSGDDSETTNPANIYFTSSFNFVAGSTIDAISFVNVNLGGDPTKDLFNITNAATINTLSFENCKIENFKGIVKLGGGTKITTVSFNKCIIGNIKGDAILNVAASPTLMSNFLLTNSTIYKADKVIVSGSNSNSLLYENCTFNQSPVKDAYYIDYGNGFEITSGGVVNNCILGVGNPSPVRGIRAKTATANGLKVTNTYSTSDYISTSAPLKGVILYSGASTALFTDPENGNFKIKDAAFAGKNSAGDPRWR